MRRLDKPPGMRASLRRRTIALVAAYAVALQALLPSFALTAFAGESLPVPSAEICTNAGASGDQLPGKDRTGCGHGIACLMTGCSGIAVALTCIQQFGLRTLPSAVLALHPAESPTIRIGRPHCARAPPHA